MLDTYRTYVVHAKRRLYMGIKLNGANWVDIIEISIISPHFTANEPNQWWGSIGFCIRIYVPYDVTYEASEK